MERTRKAAVAGQFYPDSVKELNRLIGEIDQRTSEKRIILPKGVNIIGGVVPHAGYIYSAWQAIPLYHSIGESGQHFDTVVVVNPNHRGFGSGPYNTCGYSEWETPLGKLAVDEELTVMLDIEPYGPAHRYEHSGEVQLPLLQYFLPKGFRIVMITMNDQSHRWSLRLAEQIRKAVDISKKKILVLASSDFSHYLQPDQGAKLDQYVLDEILRQNPSGVTEAIHKHQVSACGYGPIMTLMEYARLSVPKVAINIVARGHSGEQIPSDKVVDYVSLIFFERTSL